MKRIVRLFLGATVVAVALSLFMLTLAIVIRTTVPDPRAVTGDHPPAWEASLFDWAWSLAPARTREEAEARSDNDPLRDWGEACGIFKLTPDDAQLLKPEFSSLNRLGGGLYADRITLANQINWSAQIIRLTTLATIVLGFCASVLVALANGEYKDENTNTAKWIKRLAVAAPALITAVAGYAAFEAPRTQVLRLTQVMPGLQKLHRQVGLDLKTVQCPRNNDETQKVLSRIAKWASDWQELRFDPDLLRLSDAAGGGLSK